jgi:hypothetical protein
MQTDCRNSLRSQLKVIFYEDLLGWGGVIFIITFPIDYIVSYGFTISSFDHNEIRWLLYKATVRAMIAGLIIGLLRRRRKRLNDKGIIH